jgi:transcriptional regulator with XRE-family HTH domain
LQYIDICLIIKAKEVIDMTVADRIKDLRVKQGLSQDDLAKKMGFKNRSSVTQVEKSGNDITLRKVEKYAKALGVSPAYLMGWEDYDVVISPSGPGDPIIVEVKRISEDMSTDSKIQLLNYARFLKESEKGGD